MPNLSDTRSLTLSRAAQREDGNLLPLPNSLRGGAAHKVVGALMRRGLVTEIVTENHVIADVALNTFWRNEPDGRAVCLRITDAALEALGIAAQAATGAPLSGEARGAAPIAEQGPGAPPRARAPRSGTKQAALIALLERPEGATVAEAAAALGWQPHTVRGAISGALKKKLGLDITSEKREGRGTVYRLPAV